MTRHGSSAITAALSRRRPTDHDAPASGTAAEKRQYLNEYIMTGAGMEPDIAASDSAHAARPLLRSSKLTIPKHKSP